MGNQTKGKEVRIEKVNQVLMYKGESQRVDDMKWHPKPTIKYVYSSPVLLCEAGLVTTTVKLSRCKHLSPKGEKCSHPQLSQGLWPFNYYFLSSVTFAYFKLTFH